MQSLTQAHPLEQFARLIPAPGTPSHSQAQADGDILNCGEGCKEVKRLENHATVRTAVAIQLAWTQGGEINPGHVHLSFPGTAQAGDKIDKRRFPAATWPGKGNRFSLFNVETGKLEPDRGTTHRPQLKAYITDAYHGFKNAPDPHYPHPAPSAPPTS